MRAGKELPEMLAAILEWARGVCIEGSMKQNWVESSTFVVHDSVPLNHLAGLGLHLYSATSSWVLAMFSFMNSREEL